jgi:hypothetical protein
MDSLDFKQDLEPKVSHNLEKEVCEGICQLGWSFAAEICTPVQVEVWFVIQDQIWDDEWKDTQ